MPVEGRVHRGHLDEAGAPHSLPCLGHRSVKPTDHMLTAIVHIDEPTPGVHELPQLPERWWGCSSP